MLKPAGAAPAKLAVGRRRTAARAAGPALLVLALGLGWLAVTLHSTGLRWGRYLVLGPFFSGTVRLRPTERVVILSSRAPAQSMRWQSDPVGPGWTMTVKMPWSWLSWDRQGSSAGAVVRRVCGFYVVEPWAKP
jgi:hypothetical protein